MPEPNPSLTRTVTELERHVAEAGWDRPTSLYALVDTADLLIREPQLAGLLGLAAGQAPPGSLTPVEQENLPAEPLDEMLAALTWPEPVLGVALVHEALVLPPGADADAPDEEEAVAAWAAAHPDRREVRFAVGVLRDGSQACALRVRGSGSAAEDSPDDDDEPVLTGPDLAPRLTAALLATLL